MDNQRSPFKWVVLTVGTLFGIAHIGVFSHPIDKDTFTIISPPVGDYTGYTVVAGEHGHPIDFRQGILGSDISPYTNLSPPLPSSPS